MVRTLFSPALFPLLLPLVLVATFACGGSSPDIVHAEDAGPVVDEEPIVFTVAAEVETTDRRVIARQYCVYTILSAGGDCPDFGVGDRLCIDCPSSRTCPGPAGGRGRYRHVDAEGAVICRGEWARSFNLRDPDACIDCRRGQRGYRFVE